MRGAGGISGIPKKIAGNPWSELDPTRKKKSEVSRRENALRFLRIYSNALGKESTRKARSRSREKEKNQKERDRETFAKTTATEKTAGVF